MSQEESIFGADPDQLRELVQSGLEAEDMAVQEDAPASEPMKGLIERPGGRIGRYKLLRALGEGGMGIVHLAEQEGAIRRKVALKVIKPGMDSKRVIARFETERQALALLDHPNVAQVYDAGTTEAGRPYFVMEYVKGIAITEYCDRHRLTIEQRLRLFQQVCAAVQHAHQKGIIHRDIKPSNILVSAENDQAVPKIIDFGVAKAMSQPLTERTLFTEDNRLLGTPEYMSPEQAEMVNEDIDTRSDIYSLGVLLYVLLAGALPYDSETLRQGGLEHVRQTIRQVDPKTPSTRLARLGDDAKGVAENRRTEVATLARCLHRELEWIPLKAMRKERAERYRSASELADDVDNYLEGAPLMAGPPTTRYRLRKFLRRHKALVGSVAAVLVVSVVGTIVSVYFALGQAKALAEQRRDNHDFGAAAYFINNQFFKPLAFGSTEPEYLRTSFDIATERIDRDLGTSPRGEAHMRHIFGIVYTWRFHDYDVAIPCLERAIELHASDRPPNGPRNWLGLALLKAGRYQAAQAVFSEAVKTCKEHWARTAGIEPPGTFYHVLRCHLGETYRLLGQYDEAEQRLRAALDDVPWNKEGSPALFYRGMLASVLRDAGHYQEAERLYDEILRTNRDVGYVNYDRKLKDVTGATSTAILDLGILHTLQGNLDKAALLIEEALDKAQRIHGEEDLRTADVKIALATLRTKQGHHPEAESLFDESLKNMRARLKDDHPELLRARSHLGVLYREQSRHDEAEHLLSDVRQRQTQSKELGSDHPHTFTSTHELALVYVAREDYRRAEPLLLDAYNGRHAKLSPEHPHTIDSLRELVNLYESWGRPEEAGRYRAKRPAAPSDP